MQCNIALGQVLYGLIIFFLIDVSSSYVTKLLFNGKSKIVDGISVIKLRLFRIKEKQTKVIFTFVRGKLLPSTAFSIIIPNYYSEVACTIKYWEMKNGSCLSCSAKSLYPPTSEASREVTNLTERKNPHTPIYDVKEFVCLSVPNSTPIISGLAKQDLSTKQNQKPIEKSLYVWLPELFL